MNLKEKTDKFYMIIKNFKIGNTLNKVKTTEGVEGLSTKEKTHGHGNSVVIPTGYKGTEW